MNTWMKKDKEVLVDFYEEVIQEILQPNTTSIPKNMISSLSARDERVSLLTMSGPYDVCDLDEDDYDSQDTDSSDEDNEEEDEEEDDDEDGNEDGKQTNSK